MSYTFTIANNEQTITGWSGNIINLQLDTSNLNIKISMNAFFNKGYTFQLTDLVLPPTLIQIGSNAYNSASGINGTINLSSTTATYIGDAAFMNCTGLTGPLSLSTLNLTYIGNSAFSGCNQLSALTLPSSLTYLGAAAFNNCSGLSGTLQLSDLTNLTSIGADVFNSCNQLTSVTFPSSLASIGTRAFLNVLLNSIYFQSGCTIQNISFTSSTGVIYSNTGISFTIGTGTGIISPTSNPFASYFSKWRLYNQPLPTPNDFFSSSINSFYSQFIPQTNFTFFTYHVNGLTNYNIVVKDANGIVLTTTQQTVVPVGYLYTFDVTLPSGSKTITLNDSILVLNLIELECSSFGDLNDSYNIGETMNITWSGTNPPYLLLFGGSGIAPITITTNLFANSFNFVIPPVPPLIYRITVVNENGCGTNSPNFNVIPCITIIPMNAYYYDFITVNWIGFSTSYTVSLVGLDGSTTFMATTSSTTLIWPITSILPGLYQIQVSSGNDCSVLSNTFLIVILQDICFVKDTLVETNQGNIPIQSIIPGKHTVFNQKIIDLTKTIHPDSHLVHIKAFSFGTYPNKDTTVSQEHKINGINSFREARHYVNGSTVTLVPYDFQPLYNVLLIRPGFMRVHGMMVETLDPYVMKHQPKRQMLKR